MRKLLILLVIGGVLSLLTFFVYGIIKKADNRAASEKNISVLPRFTFTTLTDTSFASESITEGPVLVVRFHPECEHCQYEISELLKSSIPTSEVKLLLITSADRNSVIKFLEPFNFPVNQNIIPLLDTDGSFYSLFGKDVVPSSYIYNKKLKLVKALYGEYKIETILKYLRDGEES